MRDWTRALAFGLWAIALAACSDDPAVRARCGLGEGVPPGGLCAPSAPPTAPTPSAPPTPVPPAPGVTGRFIKTPNPLNVALAGPGYFVLSTQRVPQQLSDLLFTRFGLFDLVFVPSGAAAPGPTAETPPPTAQAGQWRLMSPEGLFVLGFDYPGDETALAPPEARSTEYSLAFTLGGSGGPTVMAGPVALDAAANPNLQPGLNFRGLLQSQNRSPLGIDGQPRQVGLAVAQFDAPNALVAQAGLSAFAYRPEAGTIDVGLAGVRPGPADLPRPVGMANTVLPQTIERQAP